jgi:hypothetical protein
MESICAKSKGTARKNGRIGIQYWPGGRTRDLKTQQLSSGSLPDWEDENAVLSAETSVRLKRLISAAVRLWELKRGMDLEQFE